MREFERAFAAIDDPISWKGKGVEEIGVDAKAKTVVRIDARYFRPTEAEQLLPE